MMKTKFRSLAAAALAIGLAASGAQAAPLSQYRLGEDDGGAAVAGAPGVDPTMDAAGSNDLIKIGSQLYSSNTPGGGSVLSMEYDGSGDYYYGNAPITNVTTNISYSFDANMKAAGSSGFSFLASLGSNFGGIAVVEIGGAISVFFPGAGNGTGSFQPTLNAWHHYQVDYKYNGGGGAQVTTLTVDGNVVSTRNGAPAANQIINALTLGGNYRNNAPATAAARTASDFEGSFNGLIDNFSVVPEPASALLALCGLAMTACVRRRS